MEEKQKQPKKGVLKRMLADVSKIRFQLFAVVGMALVIIACNILSPQIIGSVVGKADDFIRSDGADASAFLKSLAVPLAVLAGIYAVYSFFSWLKMYTLNNVVSRRFTCQLRIAMADKISRLPVSYLDKTKTGEILARVNNNVSMMGNSIHEAIDVLLMGVLQLTAIAVMLFYENVPMALAVILLVPLSTVISTVIARKSMRYYDKMWKSYEDLYSCVEEDYGGIETVKSYNMEETMRKKHKKSTTDSPKSTAAPYFCPLRFSPSFLSRTTPRLSRCACSADSSRCRERWKSRRSSRSSCTPKTFPARSCRLQTDFRPFST